MAMFDTMVLILELIGTVAFSVSGAMVGLRKKMDIFGICILGLCTAIGGGIIRDLILGNTPPLGLLNPLYAIVALASAVLIFLPGVRKLFERRPVFFDLLLRVMDSLGLGIFTVVGIRITHSVLSDPSIFFLVFVGVISGAGGGVLRDVLAGQSPYIFVKHFYATASLIGALLCALLWDGAGAPLSMCIGALLITALRLLAAHLHWSLPKAK